MNKTGSPPLLLNINYQNYIYFQKPRQNKSVAGWERRRTGISLLPAAYCLPTVAILAAFIAGPSQRQPIADRDANLFNQSPHRDGTQLFAC